MWGGEGSPGDRPQRQAWRACGSPTRQGLEEWLGRGEGTGLGAAGLGPPADPAFPRPPRVHPGHSFGQHSDCSGRVRPWLPDGLLNGDLRGAAGGLGAARPCQQKPRGLARGGGGGFCAAESDPWECTEAGRGRAGHLRVGVSAWGQRCCDGAFPKACDKAPPVTSRGDTPASQVGDGQAPSLVGLLHPCPM